MPANAVTNRAQLGNQAVVSIGGITGGIGAFTPIGDFISLELDGGSRTIIDVSTLLSTFKEKLGGLADAGKATLTHNRLVQGSDAGATQMATALGTGYAYDFKIQLGLNPHATPAQAAAGDTAVFSAIVSSGPKLSVANDKALQYVWGLDINGAITWTAGS